MNHLPPLSPHTVRLYFCRHGQTVANDKHLIQGGGINSPLTDLGHTQAISLAQAFHRHAIPLEGVVSSTLLRAKDTAHKLSSFGDVQEFAQLKEMEYGDLEGLEITDVKTAAKMRALWQEWKLDIRIKCPGKAGESMANLIARGVQIVWDIALQNRQTPHVAVVSHSMLLRAVLATFETQQQQGTATCTSLNVMEAMDRVQLANSSITVVDFCVGGTNMRLPPTVLLLNCTDHVPGNATGGYAPLTIGMNKTALLEARL